MHTHVSIRQAMIYHLEHRLSSNPSLLNVAVADCFFILEDIYRLVASEWVVLDEYMDRELATVEYSLEKELPEFRELESFLKYLYIYRRRTQRYHELISETKAQCSQRGQKRWHCDTTSTVAAEHAQDLEDDFVYLQTKTQSTMQRIEKDIDLLTALVAIGEGKQALDENRGVARLTFLAIFFLPFSTVATVLSMSGNFAPGATQFWIFWAVALPLITLIIIFFRFQYFTKL
jgi:Mg2+ and Co2+ transporter CorA